MVYFYKYYYKNLYLPIFLNCIKLSNCLEVTELESITIDLRVSKKEFLVLNPYLFFIFKNIFLCKKIKYKLAKNDIYIYSNCIKNNSFNFYYNFLFFYWLNKQNKSIN